MSKDKAKRVARTREANLETNLRMVTRSRDIMSAVAAERAEMLAEMWSQAWLLMWGCIDHAHEAREWGTMAADLLERLEAAAANATCSFCCEPQATPERLAAFRAHVLACEKHPAHELRLALEHARYAMVSGESPPDASESCRR